MSSMHAFSGADSILPQVFHADERCHMARVKLSLQLQTQHDDWISLHDAVTSARNPKSPSWPLDAEVPCLLLPRRWWLRQDRNRLIGKRSSILKGLGQVLHLNPCKLVVCIHSYTQSFER